MIWTKPPWFCSMSILRGVSGKSIGFQSLLMGVDVDRKQCNIPWNRGHHGMEWEEADLTWSYGGDFEVQNEKWTRNSTWVKYLHFKISIYTSILFSVSKKYMSETSTLGLGINPFMSLRVTKCGIGRSLFLQINAIILFIRILIHIIPYGKSQ